MLPRGQLTKRAQERVRVEELREVEVALQQGSVVGQVLPVLDGVGPEIRIGGRFIEELTGESPAMDVAGLEVITVGSYL